MKLLDGLLSLYNYQIQLVCIVQGLFCPTDLSGCYPVLKVKYCRTVYFYLQSASLIHIQSILFKLILSDISPTTLALFLLLLAQNVFFQSFTFNLLISLNLKRTYTGSCFFIHSVSLCFQLRDFNAFTLKVILILLLSFFFLFSVCLELLLCHFSIKAFFNVQLVFLVIHFDSFLIFLFVYSVKFVFYVVTMVITPNILKM